MYPFKKLLVLCIFCILVQGKYGRKVHSYTPFNGFLKPIDQSKFSETKVGNMYPDSSINDVGPQTANLFKVNADTLKLQQTLTPSKNNDNHLKSDSTDNILEMEVGEHLVKVHSIKEPSNSASKSGDLNKSINPKYSHVIEIIHRGDAIQKQEKPPQIHDASEMKQDVELTKTTDFDVSESVKSDKNEEEFSDADEVIPEKSVEDEFIEAEEISKESDEITEEFSEGDEGMFDKNNGSDADELNKDDEGLLEEINENEFNEGDVLEETSENEEFIETNEGMAEEADESNEKEFGEKSEDTLEEINENKLTEGDDEEMPEESDETNEEEFSENEEMPEESDETNEEEFSENEEMPEESDETNEEEFSENEGMPEESDETDEEEFSENEGIPEESDETEEEEFSENEGIPEESDETDEEEFSENEGIPEEYDEADEEEFDEEIPEEYDEEEEFSEDEEMPEEFDGTEEEFTEGDEGIPDEYDESDEEQSNEDNGGISVDSEIDEGSLEFEAGEVDLQKTEEKPILVNEKDANVAENTKIITETSSDKDSEESVQKDTNSEESDFKEEFEGSGEEFTDTNDRNTSKSGRILGMFSRQNETFPVCTTPKGEAGRCRRLGECLLSEALNNFNGFLQQLCLIRGARVGICCPDNPVIEIVNPDENATSELKTEEIMQPSEGCGLNTKTRIVGGTISVPHEWTWMVALMRRNRFYCGGVIINNWYILTAAHCVMGMNVKDLTVRLGEYDFNEESKHTEDLSVSEIKRHAQFVTLTFQHDIALLKLKRSIKYSKYVGSICLPDQKARDYSDVKGTVVGWGTVSFGGAASPVLRQVTIPVWKNEDCDRTYLLESIGDSFMCAGSPEKGEDACQGDSGGPLMTVNEKGRWEVIGLVSWGRRCGDPTYPGVYTRVTTYLDWIKQNAV